MADSHWWPQWGVVPAAIHESGSDVQKVPTRFWSRPQSPPLVSMP